MTAALDTSALLAFLFHEPGADKVGQRLASALVSTVNLAEFVTKLVARGYSDDEASEAASDLPIEIRPFDRAQAESAGLLSRTTRPAGLSLGDRACLALAHSEGVPALTADRAWAGLEIGIPIEVIR